jgi:hypothetical protein
LYKPLSPQNLGPPPASAPSRSSVSVHNPAMSVRMNGNPSCPVTKLKQKIHFGGAGPLVKYSRHLGEWNQFCGQAVSTFRSQTLGPHVTDILLCCYFMSGSIHLDTWQRGVPEVATYRVVLMETAITYRARMMDCVLTWDLQCTINFEMRFSLRYHVPTLDELSWSVDKESCDMTRMCVFIWTSTRPMCGFCENGNEPLKIGKILAR